MEVSPDAICTITCSPEAVVLRILLASLVVPVKDAVARQNDHHVVPALMLRK